MSVSVSARTKDIILQNPTDHIREVVQAYASAWTRGDRAALAACYGDNFTLHYNGRHALAGTHVGKAAALRVLAEFAHRTRRRLLAVEAIMAWPERGGLIASERFEASGDEVQRVLIYAMQGGLLSDCWVYDADQSLIDRLVGIEPFAA